MKNIIAIILLGMSLAVGCNRSYRDELAQLHKDIADINARLDALCNETNVNIATLQTMIAAIQAKDYVTDVVPVIENGKEVGYQITFDKSGKVTLFHGKDGADGKDGYTPQIGVKLYTDGLYYWTLDGKWLTDEKGNMIKAVGIDGVDGENGKDGLQGPQGDQGPQGEPGKDAIAPQLKIEDGNWYISIDGGVTWDYLGQATGDKGDSVFKDIDCTNEDYIILTLFNGETIELSIRNNDIDDIVSMTQSVTYIPKYSDGRIRVKDDVVELDFQILPKSSVSRVAENWQSILSLKAIYTITRAVTFVDMPILSCAADETNGVITITSSTENLNIDYSKGIFIDNNPKEIEKYNTYSRKYYQIPIVNADTIEKHNEKFIARHNFKKCYAIRTRNKNFKAGFVRMHHIIYNFSEQFHPQHPACCRKNFRKIRQFGLQCVRVRYLQGCY